MTTSFDNGITRCCLTKNEFKARRESKNILQQLLQIQIFIKKNQNDELIKLYHNLLTNNI